MPITVNDLERTVNSGLTTSVEKSEINFKQLFVDVNVENLTSTILFWWTKLIILEVINFLYRSNNSMDLQVMAHDNVH